MVDKTLWYSAYKMTSMQQDALQVAILQRPIQTKNQDNYAKQSQITGFTSPDSYEREIYSLWLATSERVIDILS